MTQNTIGKELKIARIIVGLTKAQVTDALGISTSYINIIERGDYVPSDRLLRDLKEAVGWTPAIAAFVQGKQKEKLDV